MPQHAPRHGDTSPADRPLWAGRAGWVVLGVFVALGAVGGLLLFPDLLDAGGEEATLAPPEPTPMPAPTPTPTPTPAPTATPAPTPTPTPTPTPYPGLVDPASVGEPYGNEVEGLLTFRGNPTRTFHGRGPVPAAPSVRWVYPEATTMCGPTTIADETTTWCGTGWTGQPTIVERDDATWTIFGAYDHDVHFVDADTGAALLPPFPTGDLIKGTVTVDPDGYPLVYSGSRDDRFHIIATDREAPTELWQLNADDVPGGRWNNDWDGSALVIDDYLFEGGENSIFHIVKLNRGFDDDGLVTVAPELVFTAPGYDDELIAAVGPNVSIENSVAISGDTVYFANSGGLVQGWDVSGLADGREPERVFRYWVGDDVDASIVIDEDGFLYVSAEYERGNSRANEVGQLVKLDPRAEDPLVWSVFDNGSIPAGFWATPALYSDIVIAASDSGLKGVDRSTGEIRWEIPMPIFTWASPVVVDDVLVQADCNGDIRALDISDTTVSPPELWRINLGACIESTPAVWDGRIIVGTRGGQVFMISD